MDAEPNTARRFEIADVLAGVALALGVAARIAGAWATRALSEPDPTVVALMARHMAALKEFPVFFYGQAYMGSLEPAASALMVRLLGSTGLAVNLGPVLFAAAALAFLWRWARDAAGPWGGCAAAWAGCFGPLAYFQFQFAARGGYMVALAVNALAIVAAARMAARLRAGESVGWARWFGLGLLAGVGAWSNLIVAAALGTAALLLLHGLRGKFWRQPAGIAAGLAGFVAGFSPWLAWNARHGWASLAMSQIGGHAPLREALRNSWNRLLLLQDSGALGADSRGPLLLAAGGLALAALGAVAAFARRRAATPRERYARAGAALFCAIFALIFVTSGFTRTHTARYWVPLVPGLAVLAGIACAAPRRRGVRVAASLALAALVVCQGALAGAALAGANRKSVATLAGHRELGAALDRTGATALLAPLQLFPLNFALDERYAVSNGKQRFYEPILRRAELAAAPAYSSDFNGLGPFLAQAGAAFESIPAAGRSIVWNVRHAPPDLRAIPADAIAALRDGAGADLAGVLADGNLDTVWAPGARRDATLEWTFAEPRDVHSIQFLFAHAMGAEAFDFPRRVSLAAEIGGEWRTLLVSAPFIPLEWSGPRLFYPSGFARPAFRLEARGVRALRATFPGEPRAGRGLAWRLAEADALETAGRFQRRYTSKAVAALAAWLRAQAPAGDVYAPRWISNQLLAEGGIPEERLAGLVPRVFAAGDVPRDGSVAAERAGLFIVEPRHEAAARRTLAAHGAKYWVKAVDKWQVFTVAAGGWGADGLDLPPAAVWTGETLVAGRASARVAAALRRLRAGGGSDETQRALLAEIVRWRPAALSALPAEHVWRLGGAEAIRVRLASAQVPKPACATAFANGARLEGVAVAPAEIRAGGELEVRLHWSAGEDFAPGQEIVFLHLRDARGKIVAQDDYRGSALLWGDPSLRPVPGECVAETRRIALPAEVPPGPLDLAVGLYQPQNGRRVKVLASEAPAVRRRAAVWPAAVRVVP
ncbi:MAG: hypothetical protein EOL90_05220 [Spartobacteria bacterium]|nr:hypothetical protein [Spartobacteria bacterium]